MRRNLVHLAHYAFSFRIIDIVWKVRHRDPNILVDGPRQGVVDDDDELISQFTDFTLGNIQSGTWCQWQIQLVMVQAAVCHQGLDVFLLTPVHGQTETQSVILGYGLFLRPRCRVVMLHQSHCSVQIKLALGSIWSKWCWQRNIWCDNEIKTTVTHRTYVHWSFKSWHINNKMQVFLFFNDSSIFQVVY